MNTATKTVRLMAIACTCQRCGHTWTAIGTARAAPERPAYCAGCKTRNWWLQPGVLKPGRPAGPKRRNKP